MAFTNTVDTVGDAALTRSIIDRSITELNCNITTSIRQYAFRACAALASVNFPSATSVALGAFWQCTALTKAEFSSTVAFANNAFYGCTQLSAVILRSTDQLCTITGTPFAASAIASGTGYIYVPAALVDQYKASWTAYAEQVRAIEDYPEVADLYSWAGVFANIDNGSYASVYKVGDTVPLDLGSEGLVNMQIAAFDADDLADGSGKAPISWISKEVLATARKMSGSTWASNTVRSELQDEVAPLVPETVYSRIKAVTKTTLAETTDDDLWLPGYEEVKDGGLYPLFANDKARQKQAVWWLRERNKSMTDFFMSVDRYGSMAYNRGDIASVYIALGFCT